MYIILSVLFTLDVAVSIVILLLANIYQKIIN